MENDLQALFAAYPHAVLGVEDKCICFANAAAERLFARPLTGLDALAILPEAILSGDGPRWAGSFSLGGRLCDVTASRMGGTLLLLLSPVRGDGGFLSAELFLEMLSSLTNVGLAIDRLSDALGEDAGAEPLLAILSRNYYALRRSTEHLNLSAQLAENIAYCRQFPCDLVRLCADTVDSVRLLMRRRVELSFSCEPERLTLRLDPVRIEQLLLNLLANSYAATPDGGHIRVEVKRQGAFALISVRDDGHGMDEEVFQNPFTRYEKGELFDLAAPGGGGLGLGIVRGLAALHGGSVVIDSRPGQGTSVYVTLALDDSTLSMRAPGPEEHAPSMDVLLTELAGLLDSECYTRRYRD